VGHPSLTNYLEVNGGSNFGITDDNHPDWGDTSCQPNIVSGVNNNEADSTPICPIASTGTDAGTPALDCSNEIPSCPPGPVINIDGTLGFNPLSVTGESIADQLVAAGMTYKSYQESLPPGGAYGVNYGDGQFSNLTTFDSNEQSQGETNSAVVNLYAVKHNPFAYFASTQSGTNSNNSMSQTVPFDTLYADLATGKVPTYSWIVPNQCDDQHGQGNNGPFCQYDPNDNGTQNGLNPGLILQGDQTVQKLVTAIKASPAWKKGRNALVIIWDEDDYSVTPTVNQVLAIVDTNYKVHHIVSNNFYTHYNLFSTLETAFGLPCINHGCDADSYPMADLFQK
jgi:hypothetical protein